MKTRGYKFTPIGQSPRKLRNGLITIVINFSTKVCNTYQLSTAFHDNNHNTAITITSMKIKTNRIPSQLPITGGERKISSSSSTSSSSIVHTCRITFKLSSQYHFEDVSGRLIIGTTCHFVPLIIFYMALLLDTPVWAC